MNLPAVLRLADRVEREWATCNTRADAFPELAARALSVPIEIDLATLASELFAGDDLPTQRRLDQGFGQPALTLYRSESFAIEALCWRDGTSAIHEHGFSGAFRLLEGTSVQARFRFSAHGSLGSLELGTLERIAVERLVPGAVTPIRPGADLIHSNFHLVDPGLTLVIRTHQGDARERTFLPPGVAYDSALRTPTLHKRLQMLDTLNAIAFPDYPAIVVQAIGRADPYETLAVLLRAGGHACAQPHFADFLARVRECFGPGGGELLAAAVAAERRRSMLVRIRQPVRDAEVRRALACLLDCTDREDFEGLLAATAAAGGKPSDLPALLAPLAAVAEADRPLAAAAIAALLEDADPQTFSAAVAQCADVSLEGGDAARLERYYSRLAGLCWLEPLLSRAGQTA